MSVCETKHALAITSRMAFALDSIEEVKDLVDGMIGHVTRCSPEWTEAVDVCRRAFVAKYPWMELAILPPSLHARPGAASAFVDKYERRHGIELVVPEVAPGEFLPHDHPRQQILVDTPMGIVPLESLPEAVQAELREWYGLDDE